MNDCGVLRSHQMPEMELIFVEEADPECPFGARGVGEIGLVPTAPAIAGALYQFDGIVRRQSADERFPRRARPHQAAGKNREPQAIMKPIGVVLAAGRGRRMGGRKQLHPVPTPAGMRPLVAAAFDSIAAVCREMLVVVGHRTEEVLAALEGRDFQRVVADPDAPMFASVQAGLRAAQAFDEAANVLLQLGDHPHVAPETLELLLEVAAAEPSRAVMPEYRGQGGHPVWLPPGVMRELLEADCPQGLRGFWLGHPEQCLRVAVEDAAVVRDIDTPS